MVPLAYLTIEMRGDITVVAVRAGLFDQMPDMGGGGPPTGDIVGELRAAHLGSPDGVVLDVRAAGDINHRTLAVVFALARELSGAATRLAVCGTADFVKIWGMCRFPSVCPAYADMVAAEASMWPAGRGSAGPGSAPDPAA
jgi:hypothetical protein